MPRLKNKDPKYCKLKKYAVVYYHGKTIYLGDYDSPESYVAFARFKSEIRGNHVLHQSEGEADVTVRELVAAFLDHAAATLEDPNYTHYRVLMRDFVLKFYGDDTPVNAFTPRCLKLIRTELVQARRKDGKPRFCRRSINDYVRRIVTMFGWGVENELVQETTWRTLKAVKALLAGHPGTFDYEELEEVPDDVIKRTLPFMPPTLQALVQIQYLTGMRPSEGFNMVVGNINRSRGNGLWYYELKAHKTEQYIGKKEIPLGKPEQELIAPYLEGKKPTDAVFSPATAMAERNAEKRANRESAVSPWQQKRDAAIKPKEYREFYNKNSYRQAVEYAIQKGNKTLPEDQQIPYWTPYQLRRATATFIELENGLDEAQAQLGHRTADMTRRYSKAQLRMREQLARDRKNPFAPAPPLETAGDES